ncbi:hypothetical protein [Asticcacaulis sp. 201]|uniref:hypothetical protein n=1 Tax=Asticcacaulis sp. 201 TaxID=3028787 RepID=UPI00291616E7|nr:hypothetical protein [Asticcacaulis sp. 201]MDV6330487.1 hypothetical protein [Asticcacaulis sp. 201]
MGLEVEGQVRIGMQSATGKLVLESHELIIRGPFRRTLAIAELVEPRVIDQELLFDHNGLAYALRLPDGHAVKWLKKMTTPPPDLAQKLGVNIGHKALIWGHVDDPDLRVALINATTTDPKQAVVAIAVTHSQDHLNAALAELSQRLPSAPIWVVYPKGPKSPLPEATIRAHMRTAGLVDTKSCRVSDTLTAARFSLRKHE